MSSLVRALRDHADAVEADLARFYGLDLRDRWRFDEHGQRRLTLRQIRVRLKHLPPDSATAQALGGPGFTATHLLLMDVFQAVTAIGGKPLEHPARPRAPKKTVSPERMRKLRQLQRRAEQHRLNTT